MDVPPPGSRSALGPRVRPDLGGGSPRAPGATPDSGQATPRRLASGPVLSSALLDAWAVLAPVACAGCGAPDRSVCGACTQVLAAGRIGTTVGHGAGGLAVLSGLPYDGVSRLLILALKEEGRTDVARPLGRVLAATVSAALCEPGASGSGGSGPEQARTPIFLATIPSTRAAFRRRGYDPVLLLLRRAGLGRPDRVLRRIRQGAHQKSLGAEARQVNLAGSLEARRSLEGRAFLLVDDVLTTGSTLVEGARALRAAGGVVAAAVTLAATPRRWPGPLWEQGM